MKSFTLLVEIILIYAMVFFVAIIHEILIVFFLTGYHVNLVNSL